MTTNLEQIAKQVSLLNRLIELLRIADNPFKYLCDACGDIDVVGSGIELQDGGVIYVCHKCRTTISSDYITEECEFKSEVIQKAWSDELVKVARELNKDKILAFIEDALNLITIPLFKDDEYFDIDPLKAILNKYGRSLTE